MIECYQCNTKAVLNSRSRCGDCQNEADRCNTVFWRLRVWDDLQHVTSRLEGHRLLLEIQDGSEESDSYEKCIVGKVCNRAARWIESPQFDMHLADTLGTH